MLLRVKPQLRGCVKTFSDRMRVVGGNPGFLQILRIITILKSVT
jgi:hypothetical protein